MPIQSLQLNRGKERGNFLSKGYRMMINDEARTLTLPEPSCAAIADYRRIWMSISNNHVPPGP